MRRSMKSASPNPEPHPYSGCNTKVRRFETRQYRESATALMEHEVGWAIAVWGTFYGGLWVIAGFLKRTP